MNLKFILKYSSRKRIFIMLIGMIALLCAIFTTGLLRYFSFMIWLIIGILLIPGISNF
jgi:hypothetical protein